MARRPVLSNYPHLHNVLRNDPTANREFQSCISSMSQPDDAEEQTQVNELNLTRASLHEALARVEATNKKQEKVTRFIMLLGGLLEKQAHLNPYAQDLLTKTQYEITFSPDQIRMALKLYWDVVGEKMEQTIARTVAVDDPADEREYPDDA